MKKHIGILTIVAIGLLLNVTAYARNLKLELPISTAVNHPAWQAAIGTNVTFEFGTSAGTSSSVIERDARISDFARPYTLENGSRVARDAGAACNEALRNALLNAANAAKAKGANHVMVSYSTYFDEKPNQPTKYYFCNAGVGSSTVDLVVSYAIGTTPAPIRVTPVTPSMPLQTIPVLRPPPTATGFADVYDIAKIPYIKEPCRKAYAEWLTKPNPKSYFISPAGFCGFSWGNKPVDQNLSTDPDVRSMAACNARTSGANNCLPYAIDGVVVWRP